jgi:hypothetical protein
VGIASIWRASVLALQLWLDAIPPLQAVRYTEKFAELHPGAALVMGAAYTNERGVQWLTHQQRGCKAVLQARVRPWWGR